MDFAKPYEPPALASRGFLHVNLKVKFYLSTGTIERNIDYPSQNKISFTIDPGDQKVEVNKITLNDIEANISYNTSFLIDNSDAMLTSVHEITKKGVYTLRLDDLYILSHRSNNWHCSELKDDFMFQYEFTRDSFTNIYRDREHKGFDSEFIPCFGCSFTYGVGQTDTDTWPSLLSKKTGQRYLNLGVGGSGIDGIYNNLKLLHKKKQFDQCLILLPNFERRVVQCKLGNLYLRIHSTVDTKVNSNFHFFSDSRLIEKMKRVKDSIIKDIDNRYSKIFLHKIINYCQENKIELAVSSWDSDVYRYLDSQKSMKILPKFPELSLYSERADDGSHPHRKHYEHFVEDIIMIL